MSITMVLGKAQFGSRVDYVIPKSADLLGPIDLIVDLNAAETPTGTEATNVGNYSAWVESLGYAMIEEMSFMVGSHTVEKITGDQMNIINELMKGDTQRQHKLVGKTGRSAITLDVDETSAPTPASGSREHDRKPSRRRCNHHYLATQRLPDD